MCFQISTIIELLMILYDILFVENMYCFDCQQHLKNNHLKISEFDMTKMTEIFTVYNI